MSSPQNPPRCRTLGALLRLSSVLVRGLAGCLLASLASAQCTPGWLPGDGFPGTSGDTVRASTIWVPATTGRPRPRLVMAGGLAVVSNVYAGGTAQWFPSNGSFASLGIGPGVLPGFGRIASAIAAGPNGELVVGGYDFAFLNGLAQHNIARWDGNAWVVFGSEPNNAVLALTILGNGDVIAGGQFGIAGGTPGTSHVARWNGSSWIAMGAGLNNTVSALAKLSNGDVIAGGSFTNGGGSPNAAGVARWNGSAWVPLGTGIPGTVYALSVSPVNGDLIAAGEFLTAGGVNAQRVARWNGSSWSALASGIDGTVRTVVALTNGHVVAGGDFFANVGGQPASHVAEYNPSVGAFGQWSAMSSGLDGNVYTVSELPNGNIFAGGEFLRAGGALVQQIAQWNGSTWSGLAPGVEAGAEVDAILAAASGNIIAGGTFTHIGTIDAGHIASFDGTTWTPMNAGLNSAVRAMTQCPNGDIIVGGDFAYENGPFGNTVSRIARWTGSAFVPLGGGISTAFNPTPSVLALTSTAGGDVIAGGNFYFAGPILANNIARWNGSSWSGFNQGLDNIVRAVLVMPNGDLIAGGDFLNAGSGGSAIPVAHLARWNGSTWSSIGNGTNGGVSALALHPNGSIVVGGNFSVAGGSSFVYGIAGWNGSTWNSFGFGPGIGDVAAISIRPNGDIIAGGSAGGALQRWDGATWNSVGGGIPSFYQYVHTLSTLANGDLAVGGLFYNVGDTSTWNVDFARYHFAPDPMFYALQPLGGQVCHNGTQTLSVALAPGSYGTVTYQWWRSGSIPNVFIPLNNGLQPSGAIVSGALSPVLTLSNFHAQDAAEYFCVATGECSGVPSFHATLTYCDGDVNCDGSADFFDYLDFINDFTMNAGTADFNGDGFIDFFDYLDFVNAFTIGC